MMNMNVPLQKAVPSKSTVSSDRSALRGGAGVRSRGADYQPSGRAGGVAGGSRYAEGEAYERRYNER